ncbi:hypothetical protein R1sor_004190 [Riccia sorocarpa]|uniref:Uncharacterized protein n=1 Tax=Riccia sorocarpa TaxID=122646 RepID=A0ABD3H4H0_9MARC
MVELNDDSKGKSALISGAEARAWKALSQEHGLVDAYLCAVTRTGGLFTRYAFCGRRYDQARLDRVYLNAGNPQRRFQLAWIRVRDLLKQESIKAKEEDRTSHDAKAELRILRSLTGPNFSEEALLRIQQMEQVIRVQEQHDARSWRIHSKVRWLQDGEAPSRYFFSQLKAKNARETIKALHLNDGTRITDMDAIMAEVEDFTASLYTAELDTPMKEAERRSAYSCITNKVTETQDRAIASKPSDMEIDTIANLMKREKSPGLDGVTV